MELATFSAPLKKMSDRLSLLNGCKLLPIEVGGGEET